jgi:hypothetical protein
MNVYQDFVHLIMFALTLVQLQMVLVLMKWDAIVQLMLIASQENVLLQLMEFVFLVVLLWLLLV